MTTLRFMQSAVAAALSVSGMAAALAADNGAIDPNTYILGHPASPRWIAMPHANQDHPAVTQFNLAHHAAVDPNALILGHPASPQWVADTSQRDSTAATASKVATSASPERADLAGRGAMASR